MLKLLHLATLSHLPCVLADDCQNKMVKTLSTYIIKIRGMLIIESVNTSPADMLIGTGYLGS